MPNIFWIRNYKKFLVVAKGSLDSKSMKMPNDYKAFPGLEIEENTWRPLSVL
jgi:hypothetical protein